MRIVLIIAVNTFAFACGNGRITESDGFPGANIHRFQVSEHEVELDTFVYLDWKVEGADRIEIKNGGEPLMAESPPEGRIPVLIRDTSVIELRAFTPGRVVTSSQTISIVGDTAVPPGELGVQRLRVGPKRPYRRSEAKIFWISQEGEEAILFQDGVEVYRTDDLNEVRRGTWSFVAPKELSIFRLVVVRGAESVERTLEVQSVFVPFAPEVERFELSNHIFLVGQKAHLQWSLSDATRVVLYESGRKVFETEDPMMVLNGEVKLPIERFTNRYLLRAENADGAVHAELERVADDASRIETFSVSDALVEGFPAEVRVRWDAMGELELWNNGQRVENFTGRDLKGERPLEVWEASELSLVARGRNDTEVRVLRVDPVASQVLPSQPQWVTQSLDFGSAPVQAAAGGVGARTFRFWLDAPADVRIWADCRDVSLRSSVAGVELDSNPMDFCGRINTRTARGAPLPAGGYLIHVGGTEQRAFEITAQHIPAAPQFSVSDEEVSP